MNDYVYTKSPVDTGALWNSIVAAIPTDPDLVSIEDNGEAEENLTVTFNADLSAEQETTLDGIVESHVPPTPKDIVHWRQTLAVSATVTDAGTQRIGGAVFDPSYYTDGIAGLTAPVQYEYRADGAATLQLSEGGSPVGAAALVDTAGAWVVGSFDARPAVAKQLPYALEVVLDTATLVEVRSASLELRERVT